MAVSDAREAIPEDIDFDPNAPLCPANDWSKQMLPEGPCNCGVERAEIRLSDR